MDPNRAMQLIPRQNWEYGIADLWQAVRAAMGPSKSGGHAFEALFGRPAHFTTSGRAALYAILRSLDLPAGSGIGVPLFCCQVVFDAIMRAGMRPVFLDIMRDSYTVSPPDIEKKKKQLSAVIVVHMFGHPAEMEALKAAASPLPVIEDCAHALLSSYGDRYLGTFGAASFFSFRSGKYLSAGEGGAVLCSDPALFAAVQTTVSKFDEWHFPAMLLHCLAVYVKTRLYQPPWYGLLGYPVGRKIDDKFNLTAKSGFSARKIAPSDLRIVDRHMSALSRKIEQQRRNAQLLRSAITNREVILPFERPFCRSNYYQFTIRFSSEEKRNRMADHLQRIGIDTARYLNGIAAQAAGYGYSGDCPAAERCSRTVLTIPNYYSLPEKTVASIAEAVNRCRW